MRVRLCLLLIPLVVSASGCGYALAGRGSFLPDYIQVVGIPQFDDKSATFDLDRVLTDAVRTEFAGRGRYTVQPDVNNVDAILTGVIISVHPEVTALTAGSQASRLALVVTASFEFRDMRDNKVLWSSPSLRYQDEYDISTAAAGTDVTGFFGQNANAMDRLAQKFSKSVVTSILEAF